MLPLVALIVPVMLALFEVRFPYSSTLNGAVSGVGEPTQIRIFAPDSLPDRPAVTVPSDFCTSSWLPCRNVILAFFAMMSDVKIAVVFVANFCQYEVFV